MFKDSWFSLLVSHTLVLSHGHGMYATCFLFASGYS